MQRDPKQVKVFIKLKNSKHYKIEKLWATRLDDGLFVIDNVPFFSNDVHFRDFVKTEFDEESSLLEIKEIVTPSNRFQTRFIFNQCSEAEKNTMLKAINKYDNEIEHGKNGYYSISLEKDESVTKFEGTLQRYVKLGWLNYDGEPFDIWESKSA
jgi:hypothetical protein